MYGSQLVDAFQFNDDRVVDQQIDTLAALDSGTFVFDRQGHLLAKLHAVLAQFERQALFVRRFEQPGAPASDAPQSRSQ